MGIKDAIRQCYNIDDDMQAMRCIKDEIKENTGSCKPTLVLLTRKGCSGCAESKSKLREDIDAGIIRTVDIHSEEGERIAARNSITTVPSFLVLDCEGNAID